MISVDLSTGEIKTLTRFLQSRWIFISSGFFENESEVRMKLKLIPAYLFPCIFKTFLSCGNLQSTFSSLPTLKTFHLYHFCVLAVVISEHPIWRVSCYCLEIPKDSSSLNGKALKIKEKERTGEGWGEERGEEKKPKELHFFLATTLSSLPFTIQILIINQLHVTSYLNHCPERALAGDTDEFPLPKSNGYVSLLFLVLLDAFIMVSWTFSSKVPLCPQ